MTYTPAFSAIVTYSQNNKDGEDIRPGNTTVR